MAVSEIKVMVGQRHPNVLPMLCSFVYSNQLWMVMPYINGGSLEFLLKKNFPEVGRLPPSGVSGGFAPPDPLVRIEALM